MSLLELQSKYTYQSSKEELQNAISLGTNKGLNTNENNVFITYIKSLLDIKQQQESLSEQSDFNKKLLKTNKELVYATWILAIATIVLVIANIILMFRSLQSETC